MIYLGSDHAGWKLKQAIISYLESLKIPYEDLGAFEYDKNDDYPDYGYKVAKAVAGDRTSQGILVCGSSFGVCIVANKVKGIRAVSVCNTNDAKISRAHNNANVLCLSGWNLSVIGAKKIIKVWLNTKFSEIPRHYRRIKKIKMIEEKEL